MVNSLDRLIDKSTSISKLYHIHDVKSFADLKTDFSTALTEIGENVTGALRSRRLILHD